MKLFDKQQIVEAFSTFFSNLTTLFGKNNGLATLNSKGKVPLSQIPDEVAMDTEVTEAKVELKGQITAVYGALTDKIDAETAKRLEQDAALAEVIVYESKRSKDKDAELESTISTEESRAKGAESTLDGKIGDETTRATEAEEGLQSDIESINDMIPEQASNTNQLADKDFVNSSIATNTSYFIGTFESVDSLKAYTGTLTNNDYAFVIGKDTDGNTKYTRYKWDGEEWLEEYVLNNSSFTAEQWAAIQSGITSGLVTKLNGIEAGAQKNTVTSVNTKTGAVVLDGDDINVTCENVTDTLNNTLPKLGKVKTVNGNEPDNNGNITVEFTSDDIANESDYPGDNVTEVLNAYDTLISGKVSKSTVGTKGKTTVTTTDSGFELKSDNTKDETTEWSKIEATPEHISLHSNYMASNDHLGEVKVTGSDITIKSTSEARNAKIDIISDNISIKADEIAVTGNLTVGGNEVVTYDELPTDIVKYSSQTLTNEQKAQARTNIGAGTSSFSGNYNDLTNKPTIPSAQVQSDWNATSGMGVILNKPTIPTVDSSLDSTSTNAIQNKVVDTALGNKLDKTNPTGTGYLSLNRKADTKIGGASVAIGDNATASGYASHAEGNSTTASGANAHAEGIGTTASGNTSHAEGMNSNATGDISHAEGNYTTASGITSHAEGFSTTASGSESHAEGSDTTASGDYSHAEGSNTTASKNYSHAEGYGTTASAAYQHVQGRYNVEDTEGKYADIVGWGDTNYRKRKNISALSTSGDLHLKGSVYVGCNDDSTGGTDLSKAITGSQTSTSSEDEGSNVFTFTMLDGSTETFTVKNGSKGSTGNAPNLTIGTVTTGAAGSSASASITGTNPDYTLNLTIPRGNTGAASYSTITQAEINAGTSTANRVVTPKLLTDNFLKKTGGTMTGAITFASGQTWPTFNQDTTGTATKATRVTSGEVSDMNSKTPLIVELGATTSYRVISTASNVISTNYNWSLITTCSQYVSGGSTQWSQIALGTNTGKGTIVYTRTAYSSNGTATSATFGSWERIAKYSELTTTITGITYQSSTSATTAPTTWSATVPTVAQGSYLWTRIAFSDGKYSYSVARQGKDGATYTLPTADASTLGGVKVGSNLTITNGVLAGTPDTKKTAGATNSTSKLYLIGAPSQDESPQTYSNSGVYLETGWININQLNGGVILQKDGVETARFRSKDGTISTPALKTYSDKHTNLYGNLNVLNNGSIEIFDDEDTKNSSPDTVLEPSKLELKKIQFAADENSLRYKDYLHIDESGAIELNSGKGEGSITLAGWGQVAITPDMSVLIQAGWNDSTNDHSVDINSSGAGSINFQDRKVQINEHGSIEVYGPNGKSNNTTVAEIDYTGAISCTSLSVNNKAVPRVESFDPSTGTLTLSY